MSKLKSWAQGIGVFVGTLALPIVGNWLLGPSTPETGPRSCLTPIYGEHEGLVASVKSVLTDPSSFEYVDTRIGTPSANGRVPIMMTFRNSNLFGGTIEQNALGGFDANTCQLMDWHLPSAS